MWYLYILKSDNFKRKYIGITVDMENRLNKHNAGGVRSTKAYRPWALAYFEKFESKRDARLRELELKKSGNKREAVFQKIKDGAPSSIG